MLVLRTDFYVLGHNLSYSGTSVCTFNGFIDIIVGSIFITSFSLHIQCSLDCLSPECSSFLVFLADALNSRSFLCSAQNSIKVCMAVCTRVFQTSMCFLSAVSFLYCILFCDLICILIEPSKTRNPCSTSFPVFRGILGPVYLELSRVYFTINVS
jgi:hypothetical protein